MKRMLWFTCLAWLGCAAAPDERDRGGGEASDQPLVWQAAHTSTTPAIDGQVDPVWQNAKPLTVVVREALGGGAPRNVVLRALYTADRVYVLAQWPDTTRSDMRDPYVWDPVKKEYARPTKPDDQFALEFPLTGEFRISMLTTENEFTADVWHWKAGRGNPVGWVDDKRHLIRMRPFAEARAYDLGGHEAVYIARPTDRGKGSYALKQRPTSYAGDVVDSFDPREPTGSLADVRGKGIHDGAGWTLEMTRKLDTGHADDAVLHLGRDNLCAIAVLDDELYWRHSVSGRLLLRFVRR